MRYPYAAMETSMPGFADRLNGIGVSASAAMTDKVKDFKITNNRFFIK